MQHEIVKTEPITETLVVTDRDSYIYVCPMCSVDNRYAVPEGKEDVFCDGENFGTKVKLLETVLEVREATDLYNAFVLESPPDYFSINLLATNVVEFNGEEYVLTGFGSSLVEELK